MLDALILGIVSLTRSAGSNHEPTKKNSKGDTLSERSSTRGSPSTPSVPALTRAA
jgi:hypothetical protein